MKWQRTLRGGGGRGVRGRAPHVSPKTLGRHRCYAMTHGPTSGHPNLLWEPHTHTHTQEKTARGNGEDQRNPNVQCWHTHADTHTQRWTTIAPVKRVETYSSYTVDGPPWSQYCNGNQHRVHDHDYYKHTFRQHKHRPFRLCLVLEQFSLVARPNQAPHSYS